MATEERSLERPFRTLGVLLAVGLLITVGIAAARTGGIGLFNLEDAVFALGVGLLVTGAVLFVVLWRLGAVLEELRLVRAEHAFIKSHLSASEEKQHVILIEGMGEKYASRLNSNGIITVPQLMRADAAEVARMVGAKPDTVEKWQATGQLMQVRGVDAHHAALLVQAGVQRIGELSRADAEVLADRLQRLQGKDATPGTEIGVGTVNRWKAAAAEFLNDSVVKVRN